MPSKPGRSFGKLCFCMRYFFCQTYPCWSWRRHRPDLSKHHIQYHVPPSCKGPYPAHKPGEHVSNAAASLAGLGRLNNSQSRLSGEFWPRPRQSAGFAQISPGRCDDPAGDGVTCTASEEKHCLPSAPCPAPALIFLPGHSLAAKMPSCKLLYIKNPGFCYVSVASHYSGAVVTEPHPNTKTVTKENTSCFLSAEKKK